MIVFYMFFECELFTIDEGYITTHDLDPELEDMLTNDSIGGC